MISDSKAEVQCQVSAKPGRCGRREPCIASNFVLQAQTVSLCIHSLSLSKCRYCDVFSHSIAKCPDIALSVTLPRKVSLPSGQLHFRLVVSMIHEGYSGFFDQVSKKWCLEFKFFLFACNEKARMDKIYKFAFSEGLKVLCVGRGSLEFSSLDVARFVWRLRVPLLWTMSHPQRWCQCTRQRIGPDPCVRLKLKNKRGTCDAKI